MTSYRLVLKISDNGGGVKDDIIYKLFDPYFTTKHKAPGTGLGLYMAKELVQRNLHGVLRAENIEGGLVLIIDSTFAHRKSQFTLIIRG
ncbi:MAG: ATP-binding protein [Nitrospirae bacterium]|nr:ATP-binding protein [Nitrospirota bacterium]